MKSAAGLLVLCGALVLVPAAVHGDDSPLRATELDVCQDVVERECQGSDRTFAADVESVSFVTRVEGATGDAFVFHVWTFEGQEVRRIKLPIRRASFRTWSKKTVKNSPGRWRAEILDPLGRTLGAVDFRVLPPAPG
jgi:hypothetical protein